MSLIKYRGYDFENRKWIYSETILNGEGIGVEYFYMLPFGAVIDKITDWKCVCNIGIFTERWTRNKEIYDGDILKESYNHKKYGIVKKEDYSLEFYIEWHHLECLGGEFIELLGNSELRHGRDYIVIGNVHENIEEVRKEFLKDKEKLQNECIR
ncbi:YopX family protein [Clostridioides sp. ZZV14-6387]|uniref:YopX family protein n=1 Tax=Clostridioides sp. ZZV14-6387 TaxID=2811497 RepID=UPI001D0F9CEB|nr:hypothetical protein [Clostridioides sp. ZZV14-6387]